MLSGQIGSHRLKYDRQVVLGLHVKSFDEVVDKSVRKLYNRAKGSGIPCDMVFWFESPDWTKKLQYKREIFSALTPRSRLYVVGHGNWKTKTIAGYDAKMVAMLLAKAFQLKTVSLINVASCAAGLGSKSDDSTDLALENSTASFVEELHRLLGKEYSIYTRVHGYNRILNVVERVNDHRVFKATQDSRDSEWEWRRAGSKILWYWEGGEQKKKFVQYPELELHSS